MRPKDSYLTRLILYGCLVCTVPVLLFGAFLYTKSSKEIQKQVNRAQIQLLAQMNANAELILRTVNHSLEQLASSTVVSRVMGQSLGSSDFILYNDLRKEISNTQSSYTSLEDLILVNRKQNWMVKNSGYYSFDSHGNKPEIEGLLQLPGTLAWMLTPGDWFGSENIANEGGCPYNISLIKKLPNQKLDKYGLAIANISACTLLNVLDYSPDNTDIIMILDDTGQILFHSDPALISKPVSASGIMDTAEHLDGYTGQFRTTLGQAPYSAAYLRSPFNDWLYVSAVSIDSMTAETRALGRTSLYASGAIIAIFLTIVWLGSRRMYSPVRGLLEQISGKGPFRPRKSSPAEFHEIGLHMQRLFASREQYEQESKRHMLQAQTLFLIRLYQGSLRPGEIREQLALYGSSSQVEGWSRMAVVALQTDHLEQSRFRKEDAELLYFAIQNIIQEIVPDGQCLPPVTLDHKQIMLLGGAYVSDEAFNEFVHETAGHVQRTVSRVLQLSASLGISRTFHDVLKAPQACREGMEALRRRMYLGEGVIVAHSLGTGGGLAHPFDYPAAAESLLLDAMVQADPDAARAGLTDFMQLIFRHEMSATDYSVWIVRFFSSLMATIQQSGIPLSRLHEEGHPLLPELNQLHLPSEIEDWFWTRVIQPAAAIYAERQSSQYHTVSQAMIDMIHTRYDTHLSIEDCARELHYNVKYLSVVFRKETGSTFSDYLAAYRFNLAKKWLVESDATIKDIAEKLQYQNSQNFIRSFRKQENMTPGQYRELHRKD